MTSSVQMGVYICIYITLSKYFNTDNYLNCQHFKKRHDYVRNTRHRHQPWNISELGSSSKLQTAFMYLALAVTSAI